MASNVDEPHATTARGFAPMQYFYTYLHDAIRSELSSLAKSVLTLENNVGGDQHDLTTALAKLRDRYRFLEQVYKYHSNVEDEVVYPALDSKVRNVTLAYSVEHEDEEHLLEELSQLLGRAQRAVAAPERNATLRQLARKVEEVHTTLRKHLAKEEEQLLPLLLKHFTYREQAELVAQFLCCIPLAAVEPVLSWLKATVPLTDQASLLDQVQAAVPDRLLQQLLVTWLEPRTPGRDHEQQPQQEQQQPRQLNHTQAFVCCRHGSGQSTENATATDNTIITRNCDNGSNAALPCQVDDVEELAGRVSGSSSKPPLWEILYFHRAIRSALQSFADETRALRAAEGGVSPTQLTALVERHRFIRAVCLFHSSSEDEIVFPALRRIKEAAEGKVDGNKGNDNQKEEESFMDTDDHHHVHGTSPEGTTHGNSGDVMNDRHRCEDDHAQETAQFEELGRLLGDVKAYVRRGAKEVAALVEDLSTVADRLARAMTRHMAREESEVFPVLMRTLCPAEQRDMVWRVLCAMPLRLLERVMPWVAGKLKPEDVEKWLENIKKAAPPHDAPLVELLAQWAHRKPVNNNNNNNEFSAPVSNTPKDPSSSFIPAAITSNNVATSNDDTTMPLVSLFSANADGTAATNKKATTGGGRPRGSDDPADYENTTCGPASLALQNSGRQRSDILHIPSTIDGANATERGEQGNSSSPKAAAAAAGDLKRPLKRIKTDSQAAFGNALISGLISGQSPDKAPGSGGGDGGNNLWMNREVLNNPIDHIFQFHKALRRELKQLESAAIELQADTDEAVEWTFDRSIQDLQARFQFLRGIYQAHSKAEDEIVFPALEAKETLHNVSHAYTLDHEKEETLFEEVSLVVDAIGGCAANQDLPKLQTLAAQLARMCAAVRASLETHVRAEEKELWPLFAEHFTTEEQEHLVGVIIGRTGAEVLHTMLSWVKGSMTPDEEVAMMLSLKSASRSTAFEQWLGQALGENDLQQVAAGGDGGNNATGVPSSNKSASQQQQQQKQQQQQPSWQDEKDEVLAEVAQYLAQRGVVGGASTAPGTDAIAADPASLAADSSQYRPGWEDIFLMNQKQLEAAVRRVTRDDTLEPQRKAYLIQHLMASRYIVAQQRRMRSLASSTTETPTAASLLYSAGGAGASGSTRQKHAGSRPSKGSDLPSVAEGQQQQQQQEEVRKDTEMQEAATDVPQPAAAADTHTHNGQLGCRHYKRNCKLVAPCCGGEHVCRLCHDESTTHVLDRYAVTEMVCMLCETKQPVAASCTSCGNSMAKYYCGICHLFDDDKDRDIYHCPFCNFCRRGKGLGIDSFHCMSCNACLSLELFNKHRCTEKALSGDCPVCSDPLFESKAPIKELPCGHFMHSMCFAAYTRYSYTCPVCWKSLGDMSVYWKMIDSLLESERLPPEYSTKKQAILCNDCGVETEAPFHFVYHKCSACAGYNTRVL